MNKLRRRDESARRVCCFLRRLYRWMGDAQFTGDPHQLPAVPARNSRIHRSHINCQCSCRKDVAQLLSKFQFCLFMLRPNEDVGSFRKFLIFRLGHFPESNYK